MKRYNSRVLHILFLILIYSINFSIITFAQNEEFVYNELDKHDPFLPLVDAKGELRRDFKKPTIEKAAPKVTLMGISKLKDKFYALIDGELVKEGEVFKEMTIEKITPDMVVVTYGGTLFEIKWEADKNANKNDENK